MPARPVWKGHIRIALVSIPVEVYPATRSTSSTSFRQIHEPSGQPVHYEKVVTGIGPIDPKDIRRGFEYEKGRYVLLEDEEIEAVRLESRKTLELSQFVNAGEIPVLYAHKPYYVVPADELAEDAYIVLRQALCDTGKAGLGQLAMRGREYVVALRPCGRGMVMETLRYADEVNKASGYFRDIPDARPDAELLELATALIEKRAGPFDAQAFHDRYVDALLDLIARKKKAGGKTVEPESERPEPAQAKVTDLMAALRGSLTTPGTGAASGKKGGRPARSEPQTPARRGGRGRKAA